nr:Ig-like domain-containing protein [Acinetobacter sp. Marseille-Q1620]
MKHIDVISKGTHKILDSKMVANEISLTENSVVIINASIKDILKIERVNNALIIHFKDGEVLRIENYYDDQNTLDNSLVLKEDGGQLIWIQKLENIGVIDNEIHYQILDNVEPLLYNEDGSQYAAALPWLTGGVLVAAIAYHDKDHSQPNKTQFPELEQVKTYIDNFGSKKGEFGVVLPTDDTTPDFKIGSIPDNLTPVLYVDGKEVESEYDRTTGLLTPKELLSEGKHTIEYSLIDGSGSESPKSPEVTITIDTTSPDKPDSITNYVDDVGSIKEKFSFETVTDDTTPSFVIGTIPDDETITLYVDGKPVESTYDKDKGTLTPKVPLSEGDHEISYSLTDEVGNESELSEPVVITVDTTAPSEVVITDVQDNEINLTGPLNSGDYTNDTKPTLSGSGAEPNALITLKDETGKVLGTATADADGTWRVEPTDANKLSDGPHTLNVTQTDKAGNESPADSFDVIIDTTMPKQGTSITGIWDDVAPEKDVLITNNDYSNDTSPTLKGTITGELQANEFIAIYRDGELIDKLDATELAGKTDWSYTDKDLENGKSYQYLARVEDLAGNEGGDSNKYTINIDTDPPKQTVEIETVTDNVGASTGNFQSGMEIDDSEPTLNGSVSSPLADNEVIAIYRDGVRIGEVKPATGVVSWSYTDRGLSDKTTYHYTARVEDASGQQGPESNTFDLILNIGGSQNIAVIDSIMDDVAPQIGDITQFANDGYTNDTSPLLQGSVVIKDSQATGEKVAIYRDGVKITEVEIDPVTHKWSYQEKDLQDGKEYRYKVVVVSAAGVEGAKSVESVIHIDTTKPPQVVTIDTVYDNKLPVVDNVVNGGTTNDSTPELKGTLSQVLGAGEELVIYRNGVELKLDSNALLIDGKTWSYTDSSLEDNKSYTYTAFVRDKAGNESAVSKAYTINTQFEIGPNPVQIIRIIDDVEPKTTNEIDRNGGSTNDKTPTLEGSLDKALSTGEVLVIYRNGVEIASMTVANGSTSWRYEDNLSVDGAYTYTAFVRDAAGNKGTTSPEYKIVLDTAPPPATANIYSYTDDVAPQTGDFNSGSKTNDTSPTLNINVTGTLATGDVVAVYRDGVKVGDAILKDGVYRYTDNSALQDGHSYKYTTCIEDAAGNKGTFSSEFTISIDTTPASAVQIDVVFDDQINLTGPLTSGDYTNDTKPTLSGSGAEPNALITLKDETGKVLGTATADADGTWRVEPTDANKLSDGPHTLNVTQTDKAGNESPADSFDVIIDTTMPKQGTSITGIWDDVAPEKDVLITNNDYSNDTSPTLKGTITGELQANEFIAIYRDGELIDKLDATELAGKTDWSYTDKDLENGKSYQYLARVEDLAGNEGGDSNKYTINIDTDPPKQTVEIETVTDNVGASTGNFQSGMEIDDSEPTLNGSVSSPLADNEVIAIYRDGVRIGKVKPSTVVVSWSYTNRGLSDKTTYHYTARVEDASGQQGPESNTFDLILNIGGSQNIAVIDSIMDDVAPQIGDITQFANDGYTNDTSPLLQGSVVIKDSQATGEKVATYRDGVKITEVEIDPVTHKWSYQEKDLQDGKEYRYKVVVVSAAGVEGAKSVESVIHIDTTKPPQVVTIDTVYDNKLPVVDNVVNGGTTNDSTPELKGTLSQVLGAGEELVIYRNGVELKLDSNALLIDGKTWSYTDSSLEDNKSYTYTAFVRDKAGNESAVSKAYTINTQFEIGPNPVQIIRIIDDVEPKTTNEIDRNGGSTNDKTPTLEGSLDKALSTGEVLVIYRNGVEIASMTVANGSTSWRYEDNLSVDGAYTYTAFVRDAAGNKGTTSPEYKIVLDTVPPPAMAEIISYTDDVAPQQGTYLSGTITNDSSPTLNISVTGSLAEGDVVAIYQGTTKVGIATFKAGNIYQFTPTGLVDGTYTYTARIEDAAGNQGQSSSEFNLTVDTVPASAVQIDVVFDDQINLTGPLTSGDYTNDTKPTLSGSGAEPNALITLKDETGKVLGTATADADGTWRVEPTDANKLSDGLHSLTVTQTDAAGNESPADSFDVIIDTTMPKQGTSITGIWDDVAPEKDVLITNNDYSNDTSPTLKGTITGELQANEFIAIYRDGELIDKLDATELAGKTDWSYTDKDLENGKSYQYLARVEDLAGNEGGDSNKYTINIDTDPPKQTVEIETVTDNVGASTGNFQSGMEIDDSEPTLNGSVSSPLADNEVIAIYRDGVRIGEVKPATGVVSWSYTDRGLSDKTTYHYTARVEDASGQQGPESNTFDLILNIGGSQNIAVIDSIMDDVAPQIGDITQFANDGYTNDTSPLLQGSVVIKDSQATGEKVAIYRDGVKITEVEIDPVTHKWSYQEKDLQDGKEYRYKVVVVSAAGVEGAKSVESVIHIDTTKPPQVVTIDTVYDNKLPVVDNVVNGGTTNDSTPELKGTLSQVLGAGEELVIYRNGVELKLDSNALLIDGKTWSYTDSSLEDNKSYTYTAFVRDKAGNESAVSKAYTINTQFEIGPNPVQIIRIIDDVEPKTTNEIDRNGGSTNDKTPTLEGSLDKALSTGEVLVIYRNGVEIASMTVANGSTSWRYEDNLSVDGAYTYTAFVRDAAGNKGTTSPEYKIVLDTVPPPAMAEIISYTDDVAPQQGTYLSGTITNDSSPTLNISVTGSLAEGDVVAIYQGTTKVGIATFKAGNIYQFTPTGLVDGTYTYTARIEDAAGNQGQSSSEFNLTVDTVPASAVQIDVVFDDQINLTGPLTSGDYTNDTKPTLSGSGAEPNALITLKDETGKVLGTATADADGTWRVEPTDANKLSDGLHSLTVTQTDAAGNESPADSFDVIIDTTMPKQGTSITGIWDDVAPEKDVLITNNDYSNDTSPTLKGTITGELQANEFIAIYRDGELIDKLDATELAGKTDWSYTDKDLENGKSYQYLARVEDLAGNEGGDSNKYTINIDTDPPKQTVEIETVTDNVGASTGNFQSGMEIDDSEPTLNGSVSSPLADNEVIAIYRDGVRIGEVKPATGVVSWSYTDRGLSDKTTYHYTARVEDASGQQGPESNTFDLILNIGGSQNIAVIDSIMDDVAPQIGDITQFANDGYTNDTSPLLQGSVVIKDSQATGEKVAIYRDGVKITEVEIDPVTHKWSYQEKDLQDGKEYRYKVVVVSAAGVEGAKSVESVIHIDTTKPPQVVTIDTVYDNKLPVVDNVVNGGTTNDSTPELKGTLSQVLGAGEELVIYRNGVELKLDSNALLIDGKTWSYTDSSLEDNKSYTYTAFVRDKAGNESAVSKAYTINTQFEIGPNPVQIIRIIDDVEPKTTNEIDRNGGSTNDKTPTLEGSLDKALSTGEVLVIYRNGVEIASMTVANGSTSWRYEDNLSVDGEYTYTAFVRDAAGNKGTTSPEYKIVLDTVPPPAMAEIISYTDDVAPQQGTYLSGTITNDTSPTLNINVTGTLGAGDVVAVYRDGVKIGNASLSGGVYRYTDNSALQDGHSYKYTTCIEDAAGNKGTFSSEFIISIDLIPPPPPIDPIKSYIDDVGEKTGTFAINEVTDDKKPDFIIPKLDAGEKANLYIDGNKVDVIYDPATGTLTPVNELTNGDHKLTYTVVDTAGNESVQSPESIITILSGDNPPPPKPTQYVDDVDPIQGTFGTGTSTNDTTPGVIIGTVPAGNTPALYVDGVKVEASYDPVAGTLTPKNPLLEGKHNITYTLTNPAGNESVQSDPIKVIIDTVPPDQPAAPTQYLDNVDPNQGAFATGTQTNDATPSVVIGVVPEGDTPKLYLDGEPVESVYDAVEGTLTPKEPLADGEHNLSYTLTDPAGNESAESDPIKVIIDTVPPDQPAAPTHYIDNVDPEQGTFGTGTSTNDYTPSVVIGVVPEGETPKLYLDGQPVESVYDAATKTLTPKEPLADGEHNLSYTLTDPAGNESVQSDPIKVIIDTVPPDQPATPTQYLDNVDPNQGAFAIGTQTNDATPSVVIGVVPEGETPKLYVDGQPVESVYDAVAETLTPKEPLADGEHNLSYTLTDPAGNESVQSDPIKVIIDTVSPDQPNAPTQYIDDTDPQTGTFDTDTPTNDLTPSIIIDPLKDGETAILYVDDKPVESIYDAEKGTLTPVDPLDEGSHDITYSVVDVAGNESLRSDPDHPLTIVIDETPPPVLTFESYSDNYGYVDPYGLTYDVGTFSFDKYTNDKTPTLNGSGAESGALILLKDESGKVLGTAIADINGNWSVTVTEENKLDIGEEYQKTLFVSEADRAGNESSLASCILKVDTIGPGTEAFIEQILDDSNNDIGISGITKDTTPTLVGSLSEPLHQGDKVLIFREKTLIGEAVMTSSTTWKFTDTTIDISKYIGTQAEFNYQVRVEDNAANRSGYSRIFPILIDFKVTPKAFLFSELDIEDNANNLELTTAVDNTMDSTEILSDVTPFNLMRTFKMGDNMPRDTRLSQVITITEIYDYKAPTIDVVPDGGTTNADEPEINGKLSQPLSAGEKVYIYCNDKVVGVAKVNGTDWTYTDGSLGNNKTYVYQAVVKDSEGNVVSDFSNTYTLNTDFDVISQGTSITRILDNSDPGVQEIVKNNGPTNDSKPTLQGTIDTVLQTGDEIVIYRDGVEVGTADIVGNTWSFEDDLSSESQGKHSYSAAIRSNGVDGAKSGTYNIIYDTVAPTAKASIDGYIDDIAPQTGVFSNNSFTNDTNPVLNIKVDGNVSADESVYVYRDGQYIGKATLVSGSDYQFIDNSLEDGQTYTYTTRVVDAAGNAGVLSSEFNITVDLTPPAQPVAPMEYIDDIGSIQGTFGTDTVTDDTKPALKIGITDETPTLYVDGVKVAATYDPVEGTLTPVAALTDGSHDLSYTLTDAAGNESTESEAVTVIVDTVPPVQPVSPSEYIDNVDPLTGTFVTDTTTNDTTPSLIIGAVAVDETPTLYVDGQAVDSVYDAINGTLTPVSALTDGSHDLSYTLTDIAGNESLPSGSIAIIIDTIAPTATASIKSYTDDVGAYVGDFLKNTTTDDLAPTLNINVNQVIGADEVVQVFRDGVYIGTATLVANKKYQFTDDTGGLVDGKTYKYSTCVVDAAGNQGTMSGNFKITIDLTPPNQPDEPTLFIDDQGALQGTFGSGTFTDDTHPGVIIAPITTNETPTLYVDGQKVESTYDPLNNTLTPVQALAEGSHQVTYTVSDAAGNESVESNPIEIIVDTTPPDQPDAPLQYVDNVGLGQGVFVSDTETDDTTPGIIIGNIPTNETPTLYVDGQKVDSIYDPVAQTLTPVTALDDGTHNFTYTLTDAASNESAQSEPIVITIDTLPPAVTGISTTMVLSVDTADGVTDAGYTSTITASNQDLITRDNTPEYVTGVLSNALNAGEMLQISKDGGVTWEDVTILSGVNWSYRFNDVYSTDTTLEFAFRVRDNASNYSELDNQNRTVTIDLTGPNAISVQPKLAALLDTKTTYTFSSSQYGTAEPGTKIALINDVNNNGMWQEGLDKVIAYAIVDANGQWTISTKLPAGDLTLGFMVWDKAGNISDLSPTTSTEVKSGGESSNNAGFEVLATNWGGTTDGEGYGVNCAAVTVNADGSYSFWQSVRGTNGTKTANAGRVYSATDLYSYTSTYLAQASKTNGAGYNVDNCCYGQFVSSAVFADINRDGNADVMSQLSSYGNCGYTSYWMNNGDGTYSAKAFYQGTLNHLGGVIAYDRTGDGYLDFVLADSCSDSITFIKNNSGTLTYETSNITCTSNGMPQSAVLTIKNGLGTASVTGAAIPKDLSILHDVAGVDLDNNGTIDIVAHVDYNGTKLYGDCSRGMGILYNSGTSAGFTYINKANIFTSDGGTDYGNLQQSIVFADYNGDGWLDMFISRGSKGGCDSNESRIYLNDGTGKLNASDTQALWFGDSLSGGSAFAVDWNMDGKQDLIEVPAQVSGCAIKTGFAPTLYLNTGNDVWGKNALAMTTSKYTDITGATAVDYDWDGAVDLVLYRAGTDAGVVASGNNAPSILIRNTGVAADGTSLHVKIVDGQGINCYYGNTVQLYDSKGNLVATQVINAQSSASTDSTGIVNFYGLNPNETYSVQLLRITNGVSNNVGGLSNLGGYANNTINAAWTGLVAGKANEAYVLTAESDTAANNSSNGVGVVGTGYNDHLYASLGNDHYNGGGGWKTNTDGTQSWVANGGADILDYSKVNAQITIDVTAGTVTKVANGAIYKDTFENIEQFVGGKGDTTFTGSSADNIFTSGAGKDTFDITSGGSDTIVFNLLDKADATGGNGSDVVNGFHIGKVGADSNADVINIHDLLSNYSGTAGLYADTDALKLDIASSELNKYLQVTNDGTNTYINVNINGTGHDYATVLTLHDVKTDLLTLLANNQLVI